MEDSSNETQTMKRIRLRVATYNVLSSSLCSPSYFVNVENDKFCSSKYRLDGLFKKLSAEIDNSAIICLQEVSLAWSGKLHTFLESKDYHFVVSNYGSRFNGYMGVGIAYPRKNFRLANADIICVPDTKLGGWSDPSAKQQERDRQAIAAGESTMAIVTRKVLKSVTLPVQVIWRGFGTILNGLKNIWTTRVPGGFPRKIESVWELAKNRNNTMVSLRLRPQEYREEEDGMDFIVATYHMPCQFWEPATMTIHTAICLQELQKQAEGRYPHILAGDFNFKPNSPQYEFVTKGSLSPIVRDPSDPEVDGKAAMPSEPLYPNDLFQITLPRGPMRSAYAESTGKEPKFTNYAMTGAQTKPFCDTLDYIFVKDGEKYKGKVSKLKAVSALDLDPLCDEIRNKGLKSLPSEKEYSDHLLVAADLELVQG